VDDLIQWLSNREVDLPQTRQKKQFYVDMVEAIKGSADGDDEPKSPSVVEKSKKAPATTPRRSARKVN
jgi:hypothetical protein